MWRFAITLLFLGLWHTSASADKRIALLIGNRGYQPGIGQLKNPHNDIELVANALRKIGFRVLPPLKDATREKLLSSVLDLAETLKEAGTDAVGFLYYSGHGIASGGQNYLIPVDVDQPTGRVLSIKGVTQGEILAKLQQIAPQAAHYLVLDACRTNLAGFRGSKGFVPEPKRDGILLAYAAAPGTTASDEGDHGGPYAIALADELVRPGQVDLLMFHNVRVAVDKRMSGEQVPWFEDGIRRPERVKFGGEIKVEPVAPSAQPHLSEAERAWLLVKDVRNAEVLRAFVSQFGDTVYGALARVRLDELKGAIGSPAHNVVQVATFYATNRRLTGNAVDPTKIYGTEIEGSFQYGRAVVTIPTSDRPSLTDLPTMWRLERASAPGKKPILSAVSPLTVDDARMTLANAAKSSNAKSLLVFVHGYYTNFSDAALRTAKLAYDLQFAGTPFFYSWPSAGSLRAYWQDEEAARLSEMIFERLLDDLSALPFTDIYIVAHAMGARIVGHALQHRVEKGKDVKPFRDIVLAAPDINAELFKGVIAPKLAAMQGTRTTIYASSADSALASSKVVHGFRRVGETSGGVIVFPGLDVIDASKVSKSSTFSVANVIESPAVLKDMQSLIQRNARAEQRGLAKQGEAPNIYWQLQ
jgi:esterase/lipase superfamily enzyme